MLEIFLAIYPDFRQNVKYDVVNSYDKLMEIVGVKAVPGQSKSNKGVFDD
ncbi:MAG: hypothetical protein U9N47_06430 [Thermodesulfobacteriota bacterium]|nr:hypothetical protein [Thermodesulfobacteriota bacterium]